VFGKISDEAHQMLLTILNTKCCIQLIPHTTQFFVTTQISEGSSKFSCYVRMRVLFPCWVQLSEQNNNFA